MKHAQVALGEVADLIRGITYKPSDVCDETAPSAVACMRTKNVQEVLDESDIVWIPASIIRNSSKYLMTGDILVSSANSWNLVGKGCWVPELSYPASAGGFISILRGNQALVDLRYLYHWFTSPQTQAKLRSYSNKTTNISNLDHSRTLGTELPLPPLEEQRRIAAILDRVQGLEKLAESQIKQLDALANSSFQKSIDDARRRGTLKEKGLGNISIVAGQYGATCSSAPYDSNLPRYVRITDIQDDGHLSPVIVSPAGPPNSWADLQLDPGDLLFARSGATVGKSYMHTSGDGNCVFAGYLIRFRIDPKIALPEFVYGFTRTEAYRCWVASTQRAVAQPNINAKQYSSLAIPLPPLDEQQAYCATYRRIKEQSKAARKRQFHLVQLRHSLSRSLLDHQGGAL